MPQRPLHPLIPPSTSIVLRPSEVEYRLDTSAGVRIVRIFLNLPDPRFSAFAETREGCVPIVLNLSLLYAYIDDAQKRIQE